MKRNTTNPLALDGVNTMKLSKAQRNTLDRIEAAGYLTFRWNDRKREVNLTTLNSLRKKGLVRSESVASGIFTIHLTDAGSAAIN